MLYFAYGSFLDLDTLRKHCPSAIVIKRAVLPNFEVQFNYLSNDYHAGVTGVEVAPGQIARGVLYEITPQEMAHLDTIEDVPQGYYYRQTVAVVDEKGKLHQAQVYRTAHPSGPYKPHPAYVELMLKGARAHRLDPDYIRSLEQLLTWLKE
jgi:gamma-glutamylcyclotransferase (GGCT)/AIG2-like uncharacterized protein YtfP